MMPMFESSVTGYRCDPRWAQHRKSHSSAVTLQRDPANSTDTPVVPEIGVAKVQQTTCDPTLPYHALVQDHQHRGQATSQPLCAPVAGHYEYTKKVQNMTCILAQHIIRAVTAKHRGIY